MLRRKDFAFMNALFVEICKAVISGDMVSFQRDVDFANTFIQKNFKSASEQDIETIRDLLLSLIHTANETQFAKASDVVDLLICIVEEANAEGKLSAFYDIDNLEAYELLSKVSPRSLTGVSDKLLLYRWHKAFLQSKASFSDKYDVNGISVASRIYYSLRRNPREENNKAFMELLKDSLHFLDSCEITVAAEQNYLSFVMSLVETRNEHLLEVLFGFDGRELGFSFKPICGQYGDFELSRANVFFVMYAYYLAYYESESVVNLEEKEFYKLILVKAGKALWITLARKHNRSVSSIGTFLKDSFVWFSEIMNRFERRSKTWYGTSVKLLIFDCVVLDFFTFGITHLFSNTTTIELGLKEILNKNERSFHRSSLTVLSRYVINDAHNEYRQFCSVMHGHNHLKAEGEYGLLKTAIINLYRKEQLVEAEKENEIFEHMQKKYKEKMAIAILDATNFFCSNFIEFSGEVTPQYIPYHLEEIHAMLNNGELELTDDECRQVVLRSLNSCFLKQIKENIKLTSDEMKNTTISTFMSNFAITDVDLIIGNELFAYDDPDYDSFMALKNKCKRIEIPGIKGLTALNTKSIMLSIINVTVDIALPDQTYIEHVVKGKNVMTVNNYQIELDPQESTKYLRNTHRIVKIKVDMAVHCLDDNVGGGVS